VAAPAIAALLGALDVSKADNDHRVATKVPVDNAVLNPSNVWDTDGYTEADAFARDLLATTNVGTADQFAVADLEGLASNALIIG
jgi:hypothetical protein